MTSTKVEVYCNACGRKYAADFLVSGGAGWVSSLARGLVCSRDCKDVIDARYTASVRGHDVPLWALPGGSGVKP